MPRPQTEKRALAESAILKTLKKGRVPFSTVELTWILEGICSKSSVYQRVDVLEAKGFIKYMGKGKRRAALWTITGKMKGKL